MLTNYLLFIGAGLYLVSFIMFGLIFLRTCRTVDGIGLAFLKFLSLALSLGSLIIFIIRTWSEYGDLDLMDARAIAVINPILLVATALYLNYLFRRKEKEVKK